MSRINADKGIKTAAAGKHFGDASPQQQALASEHVLLLFPILDTNDWIGALSVQVAELNAPLSFILLHSGC